MSSSSSRTNINSNSNDSSYPTTSSRLNNSSNSATGSRSNNSSNTTTGSNNSSNTTTRSNSSSNTTTGSNNSSNTTTRSNNSSNTTTGSNNSFNSITNHNSRLLRSTSNEALSKNKSLYTSQTSANVDTLTSRPIKINSKKSIKPNLSNYNSEHYDALLPNIHGICEISDEEFEQYTFPIKFLGAGGFGNVYTAYDIKNNITITVKIQDKSKITPKLLHIISSECTALSLLDHPNILKIHGGYENKKYLYLFMDYLRGGDLFHYHHKHRTISERIAKYIFKQITSAVSYCHSQNIVHRDIKLENILIKDDLQDVPISKNTMVLTDFGFATYQNLHSPPLKDFLGTVEYESPEISAGIRYDGRKSDIWAMGICLYVLVIGAFPRRTYSLVNTRHFTVSISHDSIISPKLRILLEGMLDSNPDSRFSMEQVINASWLHVSQ